MKESVKKSWKSFFYHSPFMQIPNWGPGIIQVWYRNFYYFKKTIKVSLFWILLEPLFYLGAIGYGLGVYVNDIQGISYLDFFFSALLPTTAMMVSFFESTYSNFTKLTHQKTYTIMLMTPMTTHEIALGEIFWGATKGFLSSIGVILVASFFGLTNNYMIFACLPVLFLVSWIFACFGMVMTSFAKDYDSFIYTTSGLIIPMSLFSGTYFPIEQLPLVFKVISYFLPLTHAVELIRTMLNNGYNHWMLLNIAILLAFAFLLTNFAVNRISSKILS